MPTPTLTGIDTSHYQAFNGAPLPALTFAVHKASQGASYKDPTLPAFIARYRGTVAHPGFYHYIEPPTIGSAGAQVDNLAAAIDNVGGLHDGEFVLLDWERGSNGVIPDLNTVAAITLLCIARWGDQRLMMYTNRRMTEPAFSKWRAQFPTVAICLANTRTSRLMPNNGWAECAALGATVWQYGSGPVQGFTGTVDWDMVLKPAWFDALTAPVVTPPAAPIVPPVVTIGSVPDPTLLVGSSGQRVVWLQSIMLVAHWSASPADGSFGPVTKAGVINMQRALHVTADGVYGPVTANALAVFLAAAATL